MIDPFSDEADPRRLDGTLPPSQRKIGRRLLVVALPSARKPVQTVLEGASGRELIPVLGATGRIQLIYGVFLMIGLAISA